MNKEMKRKKQSNKIKNRTQRTDNRSQPYSHQNTSKSLIFTLKIS